MSWQVILIPTDFRSSAKAQAQVFGPYATPEEAEQGRRRVHLDAMRAEALHQHFADRTARTYVVEQESAR